MRKMIKTFACLLSGILCATGLFACVDMGVGQEKSESTSSSAPTEHTHSFGDWETVRKATCTAEGEKLRECSCGETQTDSIEKTAHIYNLAHVCIDCGVLDQGFIAPTTTYLVKEGVTDYIIVYQPKDYQVKQAVEQLQASFKEATGADLRALEYSGAHIPTGKYFFLGTQPAKEAGLSFEGLEKNSSYAIQTHGKAIYIYGNTGVGAQNGVAAYMKDIFNYTVYYHNLFDLVKAETIPFTEISKKDEVAFEYLFSGYGELMKNTEYEREMGFVTNYNVSGGGIHNSLNIIPRSKYGSTHPEWFYTGTTADGYNTGDQLYLAAENFAVGSGTLVTTVAKAIYDMIESAPKLNIFGFSAMDIDIWPTGEGYENSDALFDIYGTNVAEYIIFMNTIAQEIEKMGVDREIQLELLAYNKTLCAPTVDNLTQEQKDRIMLYQGEKVSVVPYVAPVEANYAMALDDERNIVTNPLTGAFDENSLTVAEVLQGWGKLAEEIHFWWYSLDAYSYFMPMDTITNMQKVYQFAYENKVTVIFNQSQFDTDVSTDWARLKIYLQAELAQNPYADVEMLTERFMDNYFGVGATYMKRFFDDERTWYANLQDNSLMNLGYYWLGTLRGSAWCTQDIYNAVQWTVGLNGKSPDMLYTWMSYIESAKKEVSKDTSLSAEEKEVIYERIDLESLPARWVLVKVFGEDRYDKDLEAFYDFAKSLGVTKKAESQPI